MKYAGKQTRKELFTLFKEKSPCLQGKNQALWIFPRAPIYTKTAFFKNKKNR
ncbi:hypothetical protein BSG1_02100 [Bacillus sp. SG-1]|nr:hypothetical protein BSG1_02100 [Bacillus sp. SG-1]